MVLQDRNNPYPVNLSQSNHNMVVHIINHLQKYNVLFVFGVISCCGASAV